MARAIARGLAAMFTHRPLALILWMWSLVLAVAGAAPAIRWFRQAWPLRPEADRLLLAFDLPLYRELSHYDTSPTWAITLAGAAGAAMIALVGGAFMVAGLLHVLLDRDDTERTRSLWSRFGRGGGQAFWRSLTVSVIHWAVLGTAAIAALSLGYVAFEPFEDGPSEIAAWLTMLGPWVPVAIVIVVLSAAADYARLLVVADPVCGAFRAWFSALSFTVRHPISTSMIWTSFAVMTGLVLVASFAWSTNAPTHSMAWLIALVLVQQGVMVARAMIRVGALGAQVAYAEAKGFALPQLPSALVDLLPVEPRLGDEPAARLDANDHVIGEGADQRPS